MKIYIYKGKGLTPEKKVKTKVKSILDKLGAYHCMPSTGGYGANGVPDIIACYKGLFVGIECKANGGKPTALQTKHLSLIKQAKGFSIIIDESNVNMLKSLLNHLE